MDILTRKEYAAQVDSWLGKEVIIVLTGQRRVGKSYVLKDFVQRHQQDENVNIIYFEKVFALPHYQLREISEEKKTTKLP